MEPLTKRGEQIVDVALTLISDGGIMALTTKNLAEAVGISEPALYRHFKGKVDILVAILHQLRASIENLFQQDLNSKDTVLNQIQTIYQRVFQHFSAHPAMASVVFSEEIFRHDPRLSERVSCIMEVVYGHILRLLRSKKGRAECRSDVPPSDLVRVIMATLRFHVTRWRLSGYTFDIEKEGMALWRSLRLMIAES